MDARLHTNLALSAPVEQERVDLREIWQKLLRGKRVILLTMLVGSALGYLVIKQLAPAYTASSSIMLETRQQQVVEAEAVLPGLSTDAEVIEGEIEILYSRELARRVADKLDLRQSPEFNPELLEEDSEFSWESFFQYLPSDLMEYAQGLLGSLSEESTELTDQEAAVQLNKRITDTLLDNLAAKQVGQSPVLRIAYSSESQRTAALIANTLAETYIETQLQSKYDATKQANVWLNQRIDELRIDLEQKERQIEEYRARSGLLAGKDVTVATQEMSELASQLVVARVDRQGAESRLQQVERLLESRSGADTAIEVLESNLIQDLRIQEAEVRRALAELSLEYGPNHPRIVNGQAEIQDIQNSIRIEIGKIVQGLRNQVETARQREASVKESLDELSSRVAGLNTEEVQLRALEREADATRTLLESFLARAQETVEQEGIQQPDAKIISFAEIPEQPSFPNKRLFMLIAFCASTLTGVSLAYALQALDQSFHNSDQVREVLNLPVLEIVPSVHSLGRNSSPVDFVVERPTSAFSEALRNLKVTLFASGERGPKIVLFTSSLPEEGKTSLTLSFGRFLALTDRKVVVLDCDLRKPSVNATLGGRRTPGLVNYLSNNARLDDIIQTDHRSGLDYISSGPPSNDPTGLLASSQMRMMLNELSERYDVVLIDSAPVLAVADTRCLEPMVDQTVFVLRWKATQRSTAREALRRLNQAGTNFAGVVLSRVDVKKYSQYEYGYHYDNVRKYYGE